MKIKYVLAFFFLALSASIFIACEKDDNEFEENISYNFETESHNMGQNCMNCHNSNGPGEGIFNVAGTVYDSLQTNPLANGKVELFDAPSGGNLVATLEVDGKGNFFTTNAIDFGTGLYPRVTSFTGKVKSMSIPLTTGACNGCHGVNQDRIWVSN